MHRVSRELAMSAKGQPCRLLWSLWVNSLRRERAKSSGPLQSLTNHTDLPGKGRWGELLAPKKSTGIFLSVARPKVLTAFLSLWTMQTSVLNNESGESVEAVVLIVLMWSPYFCHPTYFYNYINRSFQTVTWIMVQLEILVYEKIC